MGNIMNFEIGLPGYQIRALKIPADLNSVQRLYERCADYVILMDGQEIPPTAAQEIFTGGPPGKLLEDKFIFGLEDSTGSLLGLLEGYHGYPDEDTWWI